MSTSEQSQFHSCQIFNMPTVLLLYMSRSKPYWFLTHQKCPHHNSLSFLHIKHHHSPNFLQVNHSASQQCQSSTCQICQHHNSVSLLQVFHVIITTAGLIASENTQVQTCHYTIYNISIVGSCFQIVVKFSRQ